MKKYCLVCELKPHKVEEYVEMHRNCHLTDWKTQLHALKEAGASSFVVYNYKNLSIMFFECEDMNECFAKLETIEANRRWQEKVAPYFAEIQKFDGTAQAPSVEKIFDLNEQLIGELNAD